MTEAYRTAGVLLLVFVGVIVSSTGVLAYSTDDFITELRTKFRTTSNIYLEAESNRMPSGRTVADEDAAETATVVLAYAYPRQYLQYISGTSNKKQFMLVKNDSMAIGYPHLDYFREHKINRKQSRKLLMKNVPLAGALLGISSGEVPRESITVDSTYDTIHLTVERFRENLPFRRVEAEFKRENLTPVYFELQGERNFRVDVLRYVEEERFPSWVENALSQFDLSWMEDAPV